MPSEGWLRAIQEIIAAVGPMSTALLLLLAALALFYRRDFLRKTAGLAEAHKRRDARDERLVAAVDAMNEARMADRMVQQELARAIDRLSTTAQNNSERLAEALGYLRRTR